MTTTSAAVPGGSGPKAEGGSIVQHVRGAIAVPKASQRTGRRRPFAARRVRSAATSW